MTNLVFHFTDREHSVFVDLTREELEGTLDLLSEGTGIVLTTVDGALVLPPSPEGLRMVTVRNLPEESDDDQ